MIYMASTSIDSHKTVSEIMALLSKSGVSEIRTIYNNGEITGLMFAVQHSETKIPFRLPVRHKAVLDAMKKDRHTPRHLCKEEQAIRVAWRQLLRWLQAQLALIEIGMVDIKEVFLPYMMVSREQTFYEKLENEEFKLISHGK